MLDRKVPHIFCGIDIHIEIPRVDSEKLNSDRLGESSAPIRERVQAARGYHRLLKLARTITDLAGCDQIQSVHLAEILQYIRFFFKRIDH